MVDEQDRAYFARRAAAEKKLAAEATDSAVRCIHSDMAIEYERKANGDEPKIISRFSAAGLPRDQRKA